MYFKVTFSDAMNREVSGADAKAAFKTAQKKWGVGRFVSRISCYDYNDTYYENGAFIDPSIAREETFKAVSLDSIMEEVCPVSTRGSVKIEGVIYRVSTEKNEDGSYTKKIMDYRTMQVFRTVKVRTMIEEEVPVIHKFEKRVCIHCNQSLFDIENPNGECGGE